MRLNAHNRNTHNFPDSSSEFFVASGHNVTFVLRHSLHQTVVCVSSFVQTRQALETRVLRDSQRDSITLAQLLQFGHHAVSYVRRTFGEHTVHHRLNYVQLVFDREVDEVCIDKDMIWRTQLSVVIEE